MTDHTTDSPTGGETLEEWDGTAGTAVAYIRTLEADRARLRAEVGHLRAAITTPEVYYGVIAEEVADAYEKQSAELRQARAEVARLRAETECGTCGGTPPVSGRPCVCGGSNRASREAQGLREALFAAEARAARLEGIIDLMAPDLLEAMADTIERGGKDLYGYTNEHGGTVSIALYLCGLADRVRALTEGAKATATEGGKDAE